MTWTTPAQPIAGTAITVSFYSTNIKDNLNHLRTLTGGDPGGAGKILISTSTVAAAWTNTITESLTFASGKQLKWPLEVGTKVDYTGAGTVRRGVSAGILWDESDGNFEWWVSNVLKMKFFGATTSLQIGGNTVWHAGNLTPGNYAPLAGATFTGGISGTTASFSSTVSGTTITGTRQISTTAGSAAAPALSIEQAGKVAGLFSDGNGQLLFSHNGTTGARLDPDGRLLIGPSPPGETVSGQWIRVGTRILATAYDLTSDAADKDNIRDADDDPLATVRKLKRRRFTYRPADTEMVGLVAQEAHRVAPHLAATRSIDLAALTMDLLGSVQQLDARLDALEPA